MLEVNGDTDFASGTVETLFTFSNSTGGGTVETLGSGNANLRNAVLNALATDDILTLILYGGSSQYLTQGDEDSVPANRPTLVITPPLNSLLDEDGDTLPDAWEAQYLASLGFGADDDPDGDGVSNLNEWLAGTRPDERAPFTKLVPTTTYTGSGALIDVTWSRANDASRGQVTTIHSNSWGSGTNPSPTSPAENDDIPISGLHSNPSITTHPGLYDGSVGDGIRELSTGDGFNLLYGVQIRQTGGTIFDTSLTMRGGAKDGAGGSLSTESIFEIDDASNTSFAYTNLAISGQITLWPQNGAGNSNTLSVLNGYATAGILAGTTPGRSIVNILNGHLDVGYLSNARFDVNMLAGGDGEFNLADMYGTDPDPDHASKFKNLLLNFESGSQASFTIASNDGVSAVDYWQTKIAANKVKINGVVVTDPSKFQITNVLSLIHISEPTRPY